MPQAAHKPVECTRDVIWGWLRDRLEYRCPVCGRVGRVPTNFDGSLFPAVFGDRIVVLCNGDKFIKERIPALRPPPGPGSLFRRYVEIRTDEGRKMFMDQLGVGYGFITGLRVKRNGEYIEPLRLISVPQHCIVRELKMKSYNLRFEQLG